MSDQNNQPEVVLEARNITKRFPGVLANDQVDIQLRRGEILALLGENGAGKSTLMNIIYGLYHADEGQIFLKGQEVRFASPREAIHSGIGMVHQHFQLVDVMTVAENVVLGEERETPSWGNLFGLLFLGLFGILAAALFINYDNPLVYTTISLALVGVLVPWIAVQWILKKLFGIGMSLLNTDMSPERLNLIQRTITSSAMIGAIAAMIYDLDNTTAEIVLAVLGMGMIVSQGYLIPYVFLRNGAERFRGQVARFYVGDLAPPILQYIILLALNGMALIVLAILRLGYDSHDATQTLEFLLVLHVGIIGALTIALLLSATLAYIFRFWGRISSWLRISWGVVWRIGIIGAAIWIGGLAETITEMGIITNILQTDLPFEFEGDGVGSSGQRDYEVRWNRIDRAGGYDEQVAALLTEIDEDYYREETQRFTQDGIVFEAHIEGYYGKNTAALRDAVDEVPKQVRSIVIAGLTILLSIMAISSWRGNNVLPGGLTPAAGENNLLSILVSDIAILLGITAVYTYAIWHYAADMNQAIQILLTLIGLVVMAGVLMRTIRHRRQDPDRIRPINPLDITIDALTAIIYNVGTVRNTRQAGERVRELSRQYGLEVDPDAIIEKLPVGLQQRVEIIKALYRRADILILDEPTAVLTPQEGQELFKIMRELSQQGVSIIFITHKLKEVFEVATNIVVMRNGAVVGTTTPTEATRESLAAMMVGREVLLLVDKDEAHPTDTVLHVENLRAYDDRGALALDSVSFEVQAGEVLGIAGVQGNGQSELVEVLTGLRPMSEGAVELLGQELKPERHPDATAMQRLWAVILDLGVVAVLTTFISYFWSYFGDNIDDFQLISLQSLIIFLVLDAAYTLGSWQLWGATLGKTALSLQIVDAEDDSQPSFPALLARYIGQSAMRYSIIGYPVVAALKANTSAGQQFADALNSPWYDQFGFINCRVANQIAITSRRIKDAGASHVPEDRHRFGMVKPFMVAENLILNDYYEAPHAEEPTKVQFPLLTTAYGLIFGTIFAVLGYIWLYLWNVSLWDALLDRYGVPESGELRSIPIGVGMDAIQRNYMNDPLVVSLLLLLIMTLMVAVVSFFLTRAVMHFLKKPIGIVPPLLLMAGAYVVFGLGNAAIQAIIPDLHDSLKLVSIDLSLSMLTGLDTEYRSAGDQAITMFLILLTVLAMGGIYNALMSMAEEDPTFRNLRKRLRQSRIGQIIEMHNERGLSLNLTNSVEYSKTLIKEYDIRTPSPLVTAGSLSGGNQQKMVVAREFSRKPRLLIASQPTRGIDVGSIEFIHKRIINQRDQGAAVLLVSAELDEIMSISDRIAVMYKGHIIKIVRAGEATREELGLLMAGIERD